MVRNVNHGKLHGVFFAPPSKSYAQRALLAASLASGTSNLQNMGNCMDTDAMSTILRSLGAMIASNTIIGPISLDSPANTINVCESGLATRLLIPILAISRSSFHITGQGSILSRRMDFLYKPLQLLGVNLSLSDGCLPATIKGPLHPATIELDCSDSSQFLSGLLFALPLLNGDSEIWAINLKSRPYIDMTIEVLSHFGIEIITSGQDIFTIHGNQSYKAASYVVEGDWSGVSTIITAPGCKTIRGLNPTSYQADRAIINALSIAGVRFEWFGSDIRIFDAVPKSFKFDATDCPDLFPALAVLAARAKEGISEISGTSRLVNKESNRLLSIRDEFLKMGISVDISESNVLKIEGGQKIHSASVDSCNDHRIAMALASLALCATDDDCTKINRAESVNKSYSNFWNDFNYLYRYE